MTSNSIKPADLRPPMEHFRADVTVVDNSIEISPFRPEGQPVFSRLQDDQSVRIYQGGSVRLDFFLLTKGYAFKTIDPLSANRFVGPFEFDYAAGHPMEQERFSFAIPPSSSVSIDQDRQRASFLLTNAYDHTETFLYQMKLNVESLDGNQLAPVLLPGDPTILEDAEPPPESNGRA